jgi:hypothetical protein
VKRPRVYLTSGLYARPQLPAPDTPVGQVLAERRAGLVADLGGDLTTAQHALIDLAIRQWALLEAVDGYLLQLPSPVDKRHRRVWPVVLDRSRLAAQLQATLLALGLERKPKPVQPLRAYLAEREAD